MARNKRNAVFVFVVVVASIVWLSTEMNSLPKSVSTDTSLAKTSRTETATNDTEAYIELLSSINNNDDVDSATGKVFRGERIRVYNGELVFSGGKATFDSAKTNKIRSYDGIHCAKWNVVTTIFGPTEAVRRASKVRDWCTVIVADTKTPTDYMDKLFDMNGGKDGQEQQNTVVFLSVEDQLAWVKQEQNRDPTNSSSTSAVGKFLDAIPFRHFARKNIGYLYAIAHGAQTIFDFDDDNLLPVSSLGTDSERVLSPLEDTEVLRHTTMVVTGPKVFNYHSLMGAFVDGISWPRGFPLTKLQNRATHGKIAPEAGDRDLSIPREVGVLQLVTDENPDVDAIHRLVKGQYHQTTGAPVTFLRHVKHQEGSLDAAASKDYYNNITNLSTMGSLLVPSHTFVPYNAQASIHTYSAMFALFLPFTVEGRVSDIWRSYFSQRIFRDIETANSSGGGGGDGLKVVIMPPDIVHERNDHSLLADMQAEEDLYYKTEALLEFLNQWESDDDDNIPARMEKLWIDLYERNYIQREDVTVMQLWLSALIQVGYEFPKLQPQNRRRIKDVVLMGQFNFPRLATVSSYNEIERNNDEQVKMDLLFWYQKWRQRFNTVVLRGPFSNEIAHELRASHEIDVQRTSERLLDDKGFVSPIDNLLSTLKQYKDDPSINGVMYVHDDMLVNVTNIFYGNDTAGQSFEGGNDRKKTVYATRSSNPRNSFRIHPFYSSDNSTVNEIYYSTPDGFRSDSSTELLEHLEEWPFNWECMYRFTQVAKDPRSRPFLDHDEKSGEPFLLVPNFQPSDFLYVPTSLTDKYEEIAQLLIDHDVFLECGLPKIIDFLLGLTPSTTPKQKNDSNSKSSVRGTGRKWWGQKKQATNSKEANSENESDTATNSGEEVNFQAVDLCTNWNYTTTRGTLEMVAECRYDTHASPQAPLTSPYSAIHPLKLTVLGYKSWGSSFDWATAGTSRLDFG